MTPRSDAVRLADAPDLVPVRAKRESTLSRKIAEPDVDRRECAAGAQLWDRS
jgi:hypothetical protein